MPTVAFITLGCKVNQFDTQAVREAMARQGLAEVDASQEADAYVVNTCCVTRESHRKSLRHLRRLAREHPDAVVVALGCSVDADPSAFEALGAPCIALGNEAKARLAETVAEALGHEIEPTEPPAWPTISRFEGHTRAFVKIEDGCDDFCAYCIVPHVRGRVRSRGRGG
ncbi:tRNA (N(6)-L-threonylcarbamoyladenosine(37)-C(2))-methylthiotransferase MtaB, partial [Planctomycetota bacterium]